MSASGRLAGEIVWAIGCGSRGGELNNGLAAARAFLAAGASVCLVDGLDEALEAAAERLHREFPEAVDRVLTTRADVTRREDLVASLAACRERFGAPTVLHYNVGVVITGGAEELSSEAFSRALEINLLGAHTAIQLCLPAMREQGRGAIVTVASVAGLRWTGYDYPAYSSSKAGLIALTRSVGMRHAAEGIRANVIAPGLIETPLIHAQLSGEHASVEEMLAARHAACPTGRMGRPEDVANAAVFLASAESSYINAHVLPVDGGLSHATPAP